MIVPNRSKLIDHSINILKCVFPEQDMLLQKKKNVFKYLVFLVECANASFSILPQKGE